MIADTSRSHFTAAAVAFKVCLSSFHLFTVFIVRLLWYVSTGVTTLFSVNCYLSGLPERGFNRLPVAVFGRFGNGTARIFRREV